MIQLTIMEFIRVNMRLYTVLLVKYDECEKWWNEMKDHEVNCVDMHLHDERKIMILIERKESVNEMNYKW